jgi:hypothetical protein
MQTHPPEIRITNIAEQLQEKMTGDLQEIRYGCDQDTPLDRNSNLKALLFAYVAAFAACGPSIRNHDQVLNSGFRLLVGYVAGNPPLYLDQPMKLQEVASACWPLFKTYLDGWNEACGCLSASNPEGALDRVRWMLQHILSVSLPSNSNDPEIRFRNNVLTGTAARLLGGLGAMREAF